MSRSSLVLLVTCIAFASALGAAQTGGARAGDEVRDFHSLVFKELMELREEIQDMKKNSKEKEKVQHHDAFVFSLLEENRRLQSENQKLINKNLDGGRLTIDALGSMNEGVHLNSVVRKRTEKFAVGKQHLDKTEEGRYWALTHLVVAGGTLDNPDGTCPGDCECPSGTAAVLALPGINPSAPPPVNFADACVKIGSSINKCTSDSGQWQQTSCLNGETNDFAVPSSCWCLSQAR